MQGTTKGGTLAEQPQQAPIAKVTGDGIRLVDVSSPAAVYQAALSARRELRDQLDRLENKRADLVREINASAPTGANRVGMERKLIDIDNQMADVNTALAKANAQVATTAAIPGATVEPPRVNNGPPEEVIALIALFMCVVLLPLSIAMARRIWRRSDKVVIPPIPGDLVQRLDRLESAVDGVAVEMERVGEGQRFVTQLLAEGSARSLPVSGAAAQPLSVPGRDVVREGRT
jgi:hypothetical protein